MRIDEILDVSVRADKLRQHLKNKQEKPKPTSSKSLLTKKITTK